MALLTYVMFVSAVPETTKFHKLVSPLRSELSVIACILALGHNFSVGITSFDSLKLWSDFTDRFSGFIIAMSLSGVALMCFLLAISFKTVRNLLPKRDWKKAQRLSYVLYVMIFTQILLVSVPLAFEGETYYLINSIVYGVTFLTYATMRCIKAFKQTNKTHYVYIMGCAYLMVAIIVIACRAHVGTDIVLSSSKPDTSTETSTETSNSFIVSSGQDVPTSTTQEEVIEVEEEVEVEESTTTQDTSENITVVYPDTIDNSGVVRYEVINGEVVNVENYNSSQEYSENYKDHNSNINYENEYIAQTDFSPYKDGVYTGSSMGRNDIITLAITIQNAELINIEILENDETPKRLSIAIEILDDIIEKQEVYVDAITNATLSSEGIMNAISDALTTAPLR